MPPAISADAYPTPAPIHRHSDFWQDQRTIELARFLIDLLPAVPPLPAELPQPVRDISRLATQAASDSLPNDTFQLAAGEDPGEAAAKSGTSTTA